jgi:hypothetical protein
VATGWDEFVDELKTAREDAPTRDYGVVWARFEALSTAYGAHWSRLEGLQTLTPEQRGTLAVAYAATRVGVDWPLEWNPLRKRVVAQLERLLDETSLGREGTLTRLLASREPGAVTLVEAAWQTLATAVRMLSRPCMRAEIPDVAAMINVAVNSIFLAYRAQISREPQRAQEPAVLDARSAFVVAFSLYAHAAADLNSAMGRDVFVHLNARLQDRERP